MIDQANLKQFNEIYDKTYSTVLKYVVIKCSNINDANDIIQEIYLELWRIINKKELDVTNIKSYLIGIANNKIKKHYTLIQKFRTISTFSKNENDIDLIDNVGDDFNLDRFIVEKEEYEKAWDYIKTKKNQDIPKIFYLYYNLELSIREISKELKVSESYIKNIIYRTLKELRSFFGKGAN